MSLSLPPSRQSILSTEIIKPYFRQIEDFLAWEKKQGKIIYPAKNNIFKAFDLTPFDEVKIVILGQDPYHGVDQAMGLSFSVPEWIALPPSLKNIYKERALEYPHYNINQSWDLSRRAEQWVLLLNSILTVRAGEPASLSKIGRQIFTDEIIRQIGMQQSGVVFLLRWSYAQSKKDLIDTSKHLILETFHPSPLSSYRGWFGCNHFTLANEYLEKIWKKKIDR